MYGVNGHVNSIEPTYAEGQNDQCLCFDWFVFADVPNKELTTQQNTESNQTPCNMYSECRK